MSLVNATPSPPGRPAAPPLAAVPGGRLFGLAVPFMDHIGLQPLAVSADECRTRLPWGPALLNSRGDLHGGTLMSAFDFTLSVAARAHAPERWGAVTIDMSTHFIEAARSELTIIGRCTRRGRSIAFCDGEIVDAAGTLVAQARAVFKLVPRQDSAA